MTSSVRISLIGRYIRGKEKTFLQPLLNIFSVIRSVSSLLEIQFLNGSNSSDKFGIMQYVESLFNPHTGLVNKRNNYSMFLSKA